MTISPTPPVKRRIILDLCGGTGAWSKPYKDAGYDVRVITLPDYDILKTTFDKEHIYFWGGLEHPYQEVKKANVYGILAAPPCTMFSLARTTPKIPRDLHLGMQTVEACLRVIWECQYYGEKLSFWAMENPLGILRRFMGRPKYNFHPWNFGEPYTKNTDIWGYFNEPSKKYTELSQVMTRQQIEDCKINNRKLKLPSWARDVVSNPNKADLRAITPSGFANAFYKANK